MFFSGRDSGFLFLFFDSSSSFFFVFFQQQQQKKTPFLFVSNFSTPHVFDFDFTNWFGLR